MRSSRNNQGTDDAAFGQARDRFRALLGRRSLRLTSLREAVLRAVLGRRGHFDVEDLAAEVRAQGVSRSTIYRCLPLLVDAGILQPIVSGHRQRYETAFGQERHDHLVCGRCKAVVEFQVEAFDILRKEIAAKHGYFLVPSGPGGAGSALGRRRHPLVDNLEPDGDLAGLRVVSCTNGAAPRTDCARRAIAARQKVSSPDSLTSLRRR